MQISVGQLIAFAVVALVVRFVYGMRARFREGVPYVQPCLPFFGNYFVTNKNAHRSIEWGLENAKQIGRTYGQALPGRGIILRIVDPKCAEHILRTNFANYPKSIRPRQDGFFAELFGGGIFGVDGDEWHTQRKIASHMFTGRVLREHMETAFADHGKVLLKKLDAVADGPATGTIDLHECFFQYTMDSICTIAFGIELNVQTDVSAKKFTRAFDRVQELMPRRALRPGPIYKVMRKFKLGKLEQEIASLTNDMDVYVRSIIARRRQEIAEGRRSDGSEAQQGLVVGKFTGDLLSSFLVDAAEKKITLDDEYLRDVTLNFLVAGRDTTAALLSWTFYEMWKNPIAAAKCRREVDLVLQGAAPDGESFRSMPYLHAFLMETLRLHPSVPNDSKTAAADDVLPDGTVVKRGDVVVYPIYTFGRLPALWGPDVDEFKPERFLNQKEPSQYKFLMFNAGPRLCLGKRMAFTEAMYVASLLLQHYEFELKAGHPVTFRPSIILAMKHGLLMHVKKRTIPMAKPDANDKAESATNEALDSVFA